MPLLTELEIQRGWFYKDFAPNGAEAVRKYNIPDFSNWKNPAAFERAFARLEKDLRTSIGRK